jgi:hypothetical protein
MALRAVLVGFPRSDEENSPCFAGDAGNFIDSFVN